MTDTPAMTAPAPTELLKLADKVGRIHHMMKALLDKLPFCDPDIKDLQQAEAALRQAASVEREYHAGEGVSEPERAEVAGEALPMADHDEISRKVFSQPWDVQKAIVTIAAHCTAIRDEQSAGPIADLAACISHCCNELADALASPPRSEGVRASEVQSALLAARDYIGDDANPKSMRVLHKIAAALAIPAVAQAAPVSEIRSKSLTPPVDITGWKLVPDQPTEAMWQAGRSADIHPGDSYSKVWSAMFEAAPDVDDCETTSSVPSAECK